MTTTVSCYFVTPEGDPLADTLVEFQPYSAGYTEEVEGIYLPRLVTATTDSEGKCEVELWPSDRPYAVYVLDAASEAMAQYTFVVPVAGVGETLRLQDLIVSSACGSIGGTGSGGITELTGAVTATGPGSAEATIVDRAVTFAKLPAIATGRLLGRKTAGAGDVEELTVTEALDCVGTPAQGNILYRGATKWELLDPGVNGYFLKSRGAGVSPVWDEAAGVGSGEGSTVSEFIADLADPADPAKGAALVALSDTAEYLPGSVGHALQNIVGTREFHLWVSPGGSDLNDGLTEITPFATLQKAFNTLMTLGFIGGRRTIHLSAGTHVHGARLGPANEDGGPLPNLDTYTRDGVVSASWIVITGPDVGYDPQTNPWPTPTAIFDGGGSAANGIQLEGNNKVLIKNIKCINFNGSSSASGITNDSGWLRTENLHTANCVFGIQSQFARLEVMGGDHYGSPTKVSPGGIPLVGVRSLFASYHQIGNQQAVGQMQGPRFRYLTTGFHAQEGSTGHSDSALYEDCTAGILCTVNSRVNYSYSNFKRNNRGIRCENNSVVFSNNTGDFNFSTVDANVEAYTLQNGGVNMDRDGYANTVFVGDYLKSPMTVTGTTSNIAILSKTLPLGQFAPVVSSIRDPMQLEGQVFGKFNAALTGNVAFNIRIGASPLLASVLVPASAVTQERDFIINCSVVFQAPNVQRMYISIQIHTGTAGGFTMIDVGEDSLNLNTYVWACEMQVQLQHAGSSITFSHAHFKTIG